MKQTLKFSVVITLLAVVMGLLIVFGTFSLKGPGFSVGYSYFDVFKNTDNSYKAEGVWRLRLAGGAMVLAAILAWLKTSFASLAGGIITGGFLVYDIIRRIASKYDFLEGTADFFIFILPAIACILCLLLFRKAKRVQTGLE